MASLHLIWDLFLLQFQLLFYFFELIFRCFVPVPEKSIRGQTVLVTGAARGIGRCLAFEFAAQGAKLALVDIDKATVVATALELSKQVNSDIKAYICDVTKRDLVAQLGNEVRRDFGKVDIVVNNAGVLTSKSMLDLSEGEIKKTIDVNLLANFWTIKEFLPGMKARNSGHIVAMSSLAGKFGTALCTDYSASKFGVVGLMESLQLELDRAGLTDIHITTVCPFFVQTDMIRDMRGGKVKATSRFIPILSSDTVAKETVSAVLKNQSCLFIPRMMYFTTVLNSILPRKMFDAISMVLVAEFREQNTD